MTEARKPLNLSPSISAQIEGGEKPSRLARGLALMDSFEPPSFPPGVGPDRDDPVRQAQDADINTVMGYASQVWPGMGFLGFPFLAELSQISEYRQIAARLAQEMTRQWINVRSRSEKDKSEEIKAIEAELERLEVQAAFRTMAEFDGLFGRGQLYVDLGPTSDAELEKPLIYDQYKVKKGSLKRLRPIEPLYSYAYDYDAGEPLSPDFYNPRTWYIMKRKVHASRLLTFVSRPVPTMLKPMYAFSGMSLSQLAMPTIENFLKMRQSVANIVQNYSLRGIKTNLLGLLEGGQDQLDSIMARMKLYTQQASNEGLMVIDKDMEDFFQHTTPMTNVDKLLDQARDNICAVANIPRMVLFGISPEGMNASADGELKVFEQFIAGMQETLFRHNITKVLNLVQLSLFGEIDPEITFDFVPLREMDERQLAEIRQMNAQADNIYASLYAVASDELRKKLADDPTSGWVNLDVNRKVEPVQPEPAGKGMNPTGGQENTTQNQKQTEKEGD